MQYPSSELVEQASLFQLGTWLRFLPTPGWLHAGNENFTEMMQQESSIMDQIAACFRNLGGMTPELSKQIGWDAQ